MGKRRNERVFANVDDYEIATSTCRTEGVSEMETYGLKLLVRGQPMVEISDLDRNRDNRDVVVGFGERLKQKTVDLEEIPFLVDDYLGEVYGPPFL